MKETMNLLTLLLDGLVEFVRRHPATCLIILILALFFPAMLKGVAMFVLYFVLGCVLLVAVLGLVIRWRLGKLRRQVEEQFGRGAQGNPFDGFGGAGQAAQEASREGEVKIYRTSDAPEKRVSKDVGDYVEFEEQKDA